MKRLTHVVMLGLMLAVGAVVALAQDPAAAQSDQEAKSAVYKKFTDAFNRRRDILKGDPKLQQPGNKEAHAQAYKEANDAANEYLQKWPSETGQIPDYLKKFVTDYKAWVKAERKNELLQLVKDKKYDQAFSMGQQILAEEPNDLFTHYTLVNAGFAALDSGNKNFNQQTATYARKGVQLVESGATYVPNQPLTQKDKDDALSRFNYALGLASLDNAPAEAANAFIKVASIEGEVKRTPTVYVLLATAYQDEYGKLVTQSGSQCATEEQIATPACQAMKERLNLVADRIIDAYARAVSLAGSKPEFAKAKAEWQKVLTDLYKFRHEGKEEGLPQYISGVLNTPLPGPLPPASATPAPTGATPAATPSASGSNAAGSTSMTPTTTTTTAPTSTTPSTTTAPKTTTPQPSTTPTKPTPRK